MQNILLRYDITLDSPLGKLYYEKHPQKILESLLDHAFENPPESLYTNDQSVVIRVVLMIAIDSIIYRDGDGQEPGECILEYIMRTQFTHWVQKPKNIYCVAQILLSIKLHLLLKNVSHWDINRSNVSECIAGYKKFVSYNRSMLRTYRIPWIEDMIAKCDEFEFATYEEGTEFVNSFFSPFLA